MTLNPVAEKNDLSMCLGTTSLTVYGLLDKPRKFDSRTCGAGERNVLTASDGKWASTA